MGTRRSSLPSPLAALLLALWVGLGAGCATVPLATPGPPPEGPALQWAHASADTRAPVLALLDSEAADSRHNAAVAREEGKTAEALAEEGRAMAHEAAAAVLRGGGR